MLNDDQRLAADRPDYQYVTPQEWGCLYESMRSPSLYQFWRTYTYLMPQAEWVGEIPAPAQQKTRKLSSRDLPGCVYLALKALEQGDPQAAREFEQWLCLLCSYDFVLGSGEK